MFILKEEAEKYAEKCFPNIFPPTPLLLLVCHKQHNHSLTLSIFYISCDKRSSPCLPHPPKESITKQKQPTSQLTPIPTLVLPTGTQRPVMGSCFSTRYSLMGRPPSSSGFSHLSLQPFLVTLDTLRGPLGFPGPAVGKRECEKGCDECVQRKRERESVRE